MYYSYYRLYIYYTLENNIYIYILHIQSIIYIYIYHILHVCIYIYNVDQIYIYGYESKLCMERSALFRTYGTKGFRNWSCSGPLECDEI